MRRALELAQRGRFSTSPNPMVGAVIVGPDGEIIGEGWHRRYGEAHAEVNACESVSPRNLPLLPLSTIYVTLEPCCHHGKTPPCADLLLEKGFKKVIIGSEDPFSKVSGGGIRKLKEAGVDVLTGVMEDECQRLNKKFFLAHTRKRPFITLKWAQSADGWMDSRDRYPYRFSNYLTQTLVHRLRAENDAILTSTLTVRMDNPRLDARHWPGGRNPRPIIIGRTQLDDNILLSKRSDLIRYQDFPDLTKCLDTLYSSHGIISLLVEAGPTLLNSFIEEGLWEEARVEVNPVTLGDEGINKAPQGLGTPYESETVLSNTIYNYRNTL